MIRKNLNINQYALCIVKRWSNIIEVIKYCFLTGLAAIALAKNYILYAFSDFFAKKQLLLYR